MSKIRQFAKGQECALRFFNSCDPETVVACHVSRLGYGKTGGKPSDLFVVHGCDKCHAILDNSRGDAFSEFIRGQEWYDRRVMDAMMETQQRNLDAGLITLKGK